MKHTTLIRITALATIIMTSGETLAAETNYESRVAASQVLEQRIKDRETRMTEQANDLLRIHHRMALKLDKAVHRLTTIKDSAKSGYRVSKTKLTLINGLIAAVEKFQRARNSVLEDTKKMDSTTQKRIQQGELDHLDTHIEKHIDQILKISQSFTQDTHVKKYEQDGSGLYYDGYYLQESSRISDEYRQNRRDRVMDKKQKSAVSSALKKSIQRCQHLVNNLQQQLSSNKLAPEDKKLLEGELKNHRSMLSLRQRQLDNLLIVPKPTTTELNRSAAIELSKSMDDLLKDIQKDLQLIYIKHLQLRSENTQIYKLKHRLAAQKKWLSNNKDTSSKP